MLKMNQALGRHDNMVLRLNANLQFFSATVVHDEGSFEVFPHDMHLRRIFSELNELVVNPHLSEQRIHVDAKDEGGT